MKKPKLYVTYSYNLLAVLEYLDTIQPGIKDKIWDSYVDDGEILGNDITQMLSHPGYKDIIDVEFPDWESILWDISW